MSEHVHRFHRLSIRGRVAVSKWRCSCGIKTKDTRVVKALEGTSS